MRRAVPLLSLIAVAIALTGCPPSVEGFETKLRFVTPSNQDVFGQLERLEINFYYSGEEPIGYVVDVPFPQKQPLDDLPRADAGEVRVEVLGKIQDTSTPNGWRLAAQGDAEGFALPADDPITIFLAMKRQIAQLDTTLQYPRADATAFEIEDGRVVIFGGVDGETTVPPIEVLHPDAFEQFTISQGGSFPRVAHGMAYIEGSDTKFDGHHLVIGGDMTCPDFLCFPTNDPAYDISYFKSGSVVFEEVFSVSDTFIGAKFVQLPEGRVGLVAGVNASGSYGNRPFIFEPTQDAIVIASQTISGREQHTATVMDPVSGTVLVVGGVSDELHADAVIWQPDVSANETLGDLTQARMRHTATLLPDNRVLIIAGATGTNWSSAGVPLDSIELFNPSSETFSLENAVLTWPRMRHVSVLNEDNSVLICGGSASLDGPPLAACECYIPGNSSITVLDGPELAPGGEGMGHVMLSDGRVLFFGGLADGVPLDDIYLYIP